jgi:hypothetical protein
VHVSFRGTAVAVHATHDRVELHASAPIDVDLDGHRTRCAAGTTTLARAKGDAR